MLIIVNSLILFIHKTEIYRLIDIFRMIFRLDFHLMIIISLLLLDTWILICIIIVCRSFTFGYTFCHLIIFIFMVVSIFLLTCHLIVLSIIFLFLFYSFWILEHFLTDFIFLWSFTSFILFFVSILCQVISILNSYIKSILVTYWSFYAYCFLVVPFFIIWFT